MGVVEVDDFLPSVVSHRVDDGTMVIRTHAYGKVQETGGWREDLETRKIIRLSPSLFVNRGERRSIRRRFLASVTAERYERGGRKKRAVESALHRD